VDCSPGAVRNIREIQAGIHRQTEQTQEGRWVRATNYDELHLKEKRPPTRWELDQVSPHHPVILIHRTSGTCVLNSLALEQAGITSDMSNLDREVVHRDPYTGEPDGLISGINEQVEKAIPPLEEAELERGMKLVTKEYLSRGITSIQDTSWNNRFRHWQTWKRLVDREIIAQRVSFLLGTESLEEFQSRGLSMGSGDDRLRVGGVKLALDESTGNPHPPQADLNQLALQAFRAGFRSAFHVSDVPMLESALAAINFVGEGSTAVKNRFRLEHCDICPPRLLLRIKDSGAMVVTQPAFLYYLGQKYREEVTSRQTNWFQPVGSFNRWGVKVAFSSDSPLVTSNPLMGIYAAVTRKTEAGQKLAPQESVSILEALRMYTLGGASASSEEEIKGSISPGKLADLVVLNGDPTSLDPEQLVDLKVTHCIINGKAVWAA